MKRTIAMILSGFFAALLLSGQAQAAAPGLVNPGFDIQDASGGDVSPAAGWLGFNFAFVTQSVPAH